MRRSGKRRLVADINVVPYIDVMMVLLVIFMVTAPLAPPGQIELPNRAQRRPMRWSKSALRPEARSG